MVEKVETPGVYLWRTSVRPPTKGVYLVYVTASYQNGPLAVDMMEFHVEDVVITKTTIITTTPSAAPTARELHGMIPALLLLTIGFPVIIVVRMRKRWKRN